MLSNYLGTFVVHTERCVAQSSAETVEARLGKLDVAVQSTMSIQVPGRAEVDDEQLACAVMSAT